MSTMLISTLNELLEVRKGQRGRPTQELLVFNRRIAKEIAEASEEHRLLEYLGMKVSEKEGDPLEVDN